MTPPGWPSMAAEATPRRRRRRWLVVALMGTVAFGAGAGWWRSRTVVGQASESGTMAAAIDDSLARAPQGTRVRVRVLNASGTRGYARLATLELRDRGFDVVDYDTDRTTPRGNTLIVTHTGHDDWAERLRRAFGRGSIESYPDSLHYVDLTVFVGRDWRPATEALRP